MQYVVPAEQAYTVQESGNQLTITLSPIEKVTVTGAVTDEDGAVLSKATVSISQKLNGKYSKSFIAQTDNKGAFSMEVFNDVSTVAVSATDYITQTRTLENFTDSTNLGTFALKPIAGATITISHTYTTSVAEGEEAETQGWYSDYENIAYTLYNSTQQKSVTQFSVQYPNIVLLEEVAEGDEIRITATSKNGAFLPVEAAATIDENNRATVVFNIVEWGGIKATYGTTDNLGVVGILYDSKGELQKKYTYSSASLSITGLVDGDYTLVTMANSTFFNSVLKLAQLSASGLTEGSDYLVNVVTVKSGVIAQVSNETVPVLDESKLYYTGSNTSFTVNKTSIVAGNYLTLKGKLDFKSEYASLVSNVNLVVDLPESCSFVENSVMVGSAISGYTLDGDRLTIPLTNYNDQVRFCVIPTVGGTYSPNAFAEFTIDGKQVQQPIGSAYYEVKDLTISIPSTVAKTSVPISGTAIGSSEISIYDNGILIGQTTSLANGMWSATCELNNPYNLSTHSIYAKVVTKQGLELQSETQEVTYDRNAILVSKVRMINISHRVGNYFEEVTEFDFLNPKESIPAYWYWPDYPEFTFLIEFTNNDPDRISNVILYVELTSGEHVPLTAKYDTKKQLWIAQGSFGSWSDYTIPVNVSLDFEQASEKLVDRTYFDSLGNQIDEARIELALVNDTVSNLNEEIKRIEAEYEASILLIKESISKLETENDLEKDLPLLREFYKLMNWTLNDSLVTVSPIVDDSQEFIDSLMTVVEESLSEEIENLAVLDLDFLKTDSIADAILRKIDEETQIADSSLYNYDERSFVIETAMGDYNYSEISASELDINSWDKESITILKMTDGSELLIYYFDDNIIIVDEKAGKAWMLNKQADSQNATTRITGEEIVQKLQEAFGALNIAKEVISNMIGDWTECVKSDISLLTSQKDAIEDKWMEELAESAKTQKKIEKLERQLQEMGKQVKNGTSANYMGEAVDFNDKIVQLKVKRQSLLSKAELHNKHISYYKGKINSFKAKLAVKTALLGEIQDYWEIVTGIGRLLDILQYGVRDMWAWTSLINYILPCDAEEYAARILKKDAEEYRAKWGRGYLGAGALSMASTGLSGYCSFNKAAKLVMRTIGALVADFIKETAIAIFTETKDNSLNTFNEIKKRRSSLKCKKNCGEEGMPPCPDSPGGGKGGDDNGNGGNYRSGCPNVEPIHDPSGYVYEAVASNRLQGVTATCYYKEMVEDMYGDLHEEVKLWDAAEYAQENPLFTDENGMYRWDVPQGLWQVKFEKESYETTYSEWLPVPPPQLEVNVGMTQGIQPVVVAVRGYETGIELDFSKYMQTETMTAEYITATRKGEAIAGSVLLKNAEENPANTQEQFVSKVRFVPTDSLAVNDTIIINVSRRVKNYAGYMMESDFSQEIIIEREPKAMAASDIQVVYNRTADITVSVEPVEAAVGRTISALSISPMIADVTPAEAVLDSLGQATFTVSGELLGSTLLRFVVAGMDLTAEVKVSVVQASEAEQTYQLSLAAGWNMLTPVVQDKNLSDLPALLEPIKESVVTLKGQNSALSYSAEDGWQGELTTLVPTASYKLKLSKNATLELVGKEFDTTANTVTLNAGWNWIGYVPAVTLPVDVALQHLTAAEGDVVKGLDAFAVFDGTAWQGSLTHLEPGEGYLAYVGATKSFNYPAVTDDSETSGQEPQWNYDAHASEETVIAVVRLLNGETAVEAGRYVLGAFVDDECRGVAVEQGGRFYLTVHGTEEETFTLRVYDADEQKEYDVTETLGWNTALIGTPAEPLALHVGEPTGIERVQAGILIYPNPVRKQLYLRGDVSDVQEVRIVDASGQTVLLRRQLQPNEALDVAHLSAGIYFIVVKTDTEVIRQKFMKAE